MNIDQRLCVSLLGDSPEGLLKGIASIPQAIGVLELRLDGLSSHGVDITRDHLKAFKERAKDGPRLLFTNRRMGEGGHFKGDEAKRVQWLKWAVESGADYVDVELETPSSLRDELLDLTRRHGSRSIVSYHDLHKTPSHQELVGIFKRAVALNPDIVKIVTTATAPRDIITIQRLYGEAEGKQTRLIAFSMGELGKITRVTALFLGAPFTYCSLETSTSTAPGQLPVQAVRSIFQLLNPSFS